MASKHMQCGLGTVGADKLRVSGNGQAAELIVKRAAINRLATASDHSVHVESR